MSETGPVVTLFETYGAGARVIGPRVAQALGVPWYDQAFSSEDIEAGRYAGAPEHGGALARFLGRFAASATVFDDRSIPLSQADEHELVTDNTAAVLADAAGGGVLLGRNAALILARHPSALHVMVDATVEDRLARACELDGIDRVTASKRQKNEDHVRVEMSLRLYHWNPLEPGAYHLRIDTSEVGLDAAVESIVSAARSQHGR